MIGLNEQKKFVFKKAYEGHTGTIAEGSEICLVHGCVYFNGGLVDEGSAKFLLSLINNSKAKGEYLTEMKVLQNKV